MQTEPWYLRIGIDPAGPRPLLYRYRGWLILAFLVVLFGSHAAGGYIKMLGGVTIISVASVYAVAEVLRSLAILSMPHSDLEQETWVVQRVLGFRPSAWFTRATTMLVLPLQVVVTVALSLATVWIVWSFLVGELQPGS